ncbi:c-type cytochrome [Rufibacter sediminis]|uniref:C-type cytochrome n=1 Tax=Rufibacter sediminis TaxID=2762756 RepID=A0ABR6VUK8_9BACT|nr:cytochrome c [Rufibacter sediminis]MBC3540903.1 c-type cytochrome [Rufibacter sediminis]
MFKKILKWTALVLGSVVLLLGLFYFYVSVNIGQRIEKKYSFAPEKLEISQDKALLAKGAHLTAIKGCKDCHGPDLAGKVMIDDKALGRLVATNLTKGQGGLPARYSTTDWVRALRHGVDANGQALLFMPSHETTLLSAADMAAIIAYCQSLAPVHRQLPASELGPVVKVMTYLDKMPLLSVEKIDHGKPMVTQVDTLEGVGMGKYLAVSCSGCHGANLQGGDPVAPGFPPVPNITRAGHVGKWSKAQFMQTLRTGKTPEGKQLKNENMPWQMTAQYTDKELASLYHYCLSLQ